jgi:homoserine dehydrogenase
MVNAMQSVNVGILGLGTVGSGVYDLLHTNGKLIQTRSDIDIRVSKVADVDASKKREYAVPDEVFTQDASDVVDNSDIDVVVELIGGTGIARELMLRALRNGKHVVSANKALLAKHGAEIFKAALEQQVNLGYEASVGGGIPIIKTIREALVGNVIHRVMGILNGTSNFILTKMTREGIDFDAALSVAQELGFAEADPTLDISGGDAQHKIVILASLAFNTAIDMKHVYVEGIEHIEKRDMQYAEELGFVLKLLAHAERVDEGVLVKVHPSLVPKDNPLASISWEDNAVMVYSDYLGKSMYYGKGAGKRPTASAVVADIVDISQRIVCSAQCDKALYTFTRDLQQLPFDMSRSRYYLRFFVLDRPGILSKISGILGKNNISIASVIQKETEEEHQHVPLVMMTHEAREAHIASAIKEINDLPEVEGKSRIIRVINNE